MKKINNNVFIPMPVVLVGANISEKANFMAVGWITRANANPPMVAVGIHKSHFTHKGILENKTFSVCFPAADKVVETDYCGIVSGKDTDKSKLFNVFYGETKTAPMIKECPLNLECTLIKDIDLPSNSLFIGEIIGAYADEKFLDKDKINYKNMNLFFLTMPDKIYWGFGEKVGEAWKSGKNFSK